MTTLPQSAQAPAGIPPAAAPAALGPNLMPPEAARVQDAAYLAGLKKLPSTTSSRRFWRCSWGS
ncbi:hypothetical protein ACFP81_09320 [Deinococcus lacus]|uniref:Uncharacterized protein n=1 Tax=Deinococcus lacus TaxID=392561 RepID=A0ABW1YDK1_9DEIO